MALTPVDRDLLKRCLNQEAGSWNDFVDRYLSLIYHVIGYTAHLRSFRLAPEDTEDVAAEVLLRIVADDFKVLRQFRGDATLATYLTVVSRRITVAELRRRQTQRDAVNRGLPRPSDPEMGPIDDAPVAQKSMESLEEVEKLLRRLGGKERDIVRLYYLEGRTYEEISTAVDVPVNTIGAILSRARKKLRSLTTSSVEVPTIPRPKPAAKPPSAPPPPREARKPKAKPQ